MWASAPTRCLPIGFRRGRRPRRPASFIRGAVGGGTHGSRPTTVFVGPACPAGECGALSAGGQRRPPLRKRNKRCNGRATARVAPTECLPIGFRRGRRPRRPASVTRGAVRRRGEGTPPYERLQEARWVSLRCVGEGLSCPPSCQPTDGHCCARQSGHFLETGLLHPPLAALRRFPRPRATARVAPTKALQGVRCGAESPSHGFAVPAPFRQGGLGDGGYGLPRPACALVSQ